MTRIDWQGTFRNMWSKQRDIAQEMLTDFLTDANLLYEGISVVGYDFDHLSDVDKGSITLIAFPPHLDFVDLLLGMSSDMSHVKVRVMWGCRGHFPTEMGIPTEKRLRQAIKEFNETGTVTTKMDETVPADLVDLIAAGAMVSLLTSY